MRDTVAGLVRNRRGARTRLTAENRRATEIVDDVRAGRRSGTRKDRSGAEKRGILIGNLI